MPLVGNDIVDLGSSAARGKADDPRFLQRVLTPEEQEVMDTLAGPGARDLFLWSAWAAKEAAYKAAAKACPGILSSPRKYNVSLESFYPAYQARPGAGRQSPAGGAVLTPCGRVQVKIFCSRDCLHCVGLFDSPGFPEDLCWGDRDITGGILQCGRSAAERQSLFVRSMAAERISSRLGIPEAGIRISRPVRRGRPGPPAVYANGRRLDCDISLSHHGRFAGYAFL